MKYTVDGDKPVNVALVEVVCFSVWELPGTANWSFAEYLVAPATASHENTIDDDVAAQASPVGAGSGAVVVAQAAVPDADQPPELPACTDTE